VAWNALSFRSQFMRILHSIHSLSHESGGPAEVVRRLAETARQAGIYETEIVCLDAPESSYLKSETLPVHAVGPGLGKYGYTSRLDQWLEKNLGRFDGVIVNGLWQYNGLAARKACHGKVPYIVYAHGMLDPWFKHHYPLKHFKKACYWEAVERRLLRDATAVLFTSPLEAELAPGTFRKGEWNGVTVPNGTLEPVGDRGVQIREFYAACPEVQGTPFFLFIGRIHEKKGCDLLVRAFARLAASDPAIHLVMAGPDEQGLKRQLRSIASQSGIGDRVHFPGMLRDDSKWGAFHSAEAFVLPSHQENFGVAVTEALACGTPVLISNKVGIWREILADKVGLVDQDDLEGTFRLLEGWRAMPPADRMEMIARCRPTFQLRYDMKQVPTVIAGLFSRTLQGELVHAGS
jgi:glycosyltransferase involved in cell wall biosynthesis